MGVVTAQTAAAKRSPDSEIVMSRTTLTSPKLQCAAGTGGGDFGCEHRLVSNILMLRFDKCEHNPDGLNEEFSSIHASQVFNCPRSEDSAAVLA